MNARPGPGHPQRWIFSRRGPISVGRRGPGTAESPSASPRISGRAAERVRRVELEGRVGIRFGRWPTSTVQAGSRRSIYPRHPPAASTSPKIREDFRSIGILFKSKSHDSIDANRPAILDLEHGLTFHRVHQSMPAGRGIVDVWIRIRRTDPDLAGPPRIEEDPVFRCFEWGVPGSGRGFPIYLPGPVPTDFILRLPQTRGGPAEVEETSAGPRVPSRCVPISESRRPGRLSSRP